MNEEIKKNAMEGIKEDMKACDGCKQAIQDAIRSLDSSKRPIDSLENFVLKHSRDKGVELDGNMLINVVNKNYAYYLEALEGIYGKGHCTLIANDNKWEDGAQGPFDIRID